LWAEAFKHWILAEKCTWAVAGNVWPYLVAHNVPVATRFLIKNEIVLGIVTMTNSNRPSTALTAAIQNRTKSNAKIPFAEHP
jgi:hypothetical protein